RDARGPRVGPLGPPQGPGRSAVGRGAAVGGRLRSTRPRGAGARGDPHVRRRRAAGCVPGPLARGRLMRFHCDPTPEQRAALEGPLVRLQQPAAALALSVPIVPERLTTPQMLVDETRARCDNLRPAWPGTADMVEPLLAELQAAVPHLDSTDPAPIHGDMAAGQFLWTGDRLLLLDWDMFGFADPAYDAGHFVAQLERRCTLDHTLPPEAGRWPGCFRDAYLAAMPEVSPRNVSFYRALTLLQKTYTVCRRQPAEGPQQAVRLAACARAALEDVRRQ